MCPFYLFSHEYFCIQGVQIIFLRIHLLENAWKVCFNARVFRFIKHVFIRWLWFKWGRRRRRFAATDPILEPEILKRGEFQESRTSCPKIRHNGVAHRKTSQVGHAGETAFPKTSHTVGIEDKSVKLRELSNDVKLTEMQRPHVQNLTAQTLREDVPEKKKAIKG